MDISRYLDRIHYSGPRTPSVQALRQLHRAHLFAIPFENLSIGWGEPIELNDVAHYWKMVECHRGGFCFEQNSLFAWALGELGYQVTLLGAEVFSDGGYGFELSHLALRVELDEPMLVDVGFGDSFLNPIVMRLDAVHAEPPNRDFRITEANGLFTLEMREANAAFAPRYRFSITPRRIEEFEGMCHYHQVSQDSHFTQKRIITLARPDGRITLVDRHLSEIAADGSRHESDLRNDDEVADVLLQQFGIIAPRIGASMAHLTNP